MPHHRPYEGIKPKAVNTVNLWIIAIFILIFFLILMPVFCSQVFYRKPPAMPIDKVEHRRLLTKHGPQHQIAVIEHGWDGRRIEWKEVAVQNE